MKLRKRLFTASALVTITSTIAVGAAGTSASFRSEIERIDSAISGVVASTQAASADPITAAIQDASLSPVQISIALLDSTNEVVTVQGDDTLITKAPPAAQLILAETAIETIDANQDYRVRSVSIDGGAHILVAAKISEIQSARDANIFGLLGFAAISVAIALLALWWVIRFDIRVVERLARDARRISRGEEDVQLPHIKGGSEVALLSKSLGEMVHALEAAIRTERGAQQAMQAFMGDASHELRTPLTVIKGYAEMLGSQGGKKEFREKALQRITTEVARMEQLINDLLLLAELGETRERKNVQVNLSDMFESAVTDLKSLDKKRKVSAKIQKDILFEGSPEHLQQMINNIFSNIRRHTPKTAEVSVSITAEKNSIRLVVEDAGPGLPSVAYDRGIDSFERFDAFASRANGGSGLGMTIMRTIVRQHEGTINLSKSEKLGGLRTEISLPL